MAKIIQGFQHHYFYVRIDSRYADAIIVSGGDQTSDEGSVTVPVPGLAVLANEILTYDVIDITVLVVIDPVIGYLARVFPDVVP